MSIANYLHRPNYSPRKLVKGIQKDSDYLKVILKFVLNLFRRLFQLCSHPKLSLHHYLLWRKHWRLLVRWEVPHMEPHITAQRTVEKMNRSVCTFKNNDRIRLLVCIMSHCDLHWSSNDVYTSNFNLLPFSSRRINGLKSVETIVLSFSSGYKSSLQCTKWEVIRQSTIVI